MIHFQLDQRSLALHRLVAEKMRHDPALLEQARRTLARWRASGPSRSDRYLDEWQRLLDGGVEACLIVALDDSEHATALRQSSPLSCLISPHERFEFLKQWRQLHAAS